MGDHKMLETPLVDKFGVSKDDLCSLIDNDRIRDGGSWGKVESLGGINRLLEALHTDERKGISSDKDEKKTRRHVFGDNHPHERKAVGFFTLIWECLGDTTLQILCVAAIISLVFGTLEDPEGGWLEGVAILVAVVIVVLVTAVNDYLKELQFRKLNKEAQTRLISVVREGKEKQKSVFHLLVGDVIKINAGDLMPVDAIVLRSTSLKADESSVTGEADIIKKGLGEKESPFLISGATITEGTATAVVIAVGPNSYQGKNAELLREEESDETPLQKKLNRISQGIGWLGFSVAVLTFIVLIIYIILDSVDEGEWGSESWGKLISGFIIAVTIIVVAVPEGLPLAVTLSLAYSVGQMKKLNNLVRHLDASETMGQATNICSDKTGTLTQNIMKVVSLYVQDTILEKPKKEDIQETAMDLLTLNFCHNSTASISYKGHKKTFTGSRTEIALLDLAKEFGVEYTNVRDPNLIKAQVPFNSTLKRMVTVIEGNEENYVLVKGASEVILKLCNYYLSAEGNAEELSDEKRDDIQSNVINHFASQAQRTLTFAYKSVPTDFQLTNDEGEVNLEDLETDLILVGITGIVDPIREEVPDAVAACHKAKIKVRMVTGDNRDTAMAIAKECHILPREYNHQDGDSVVMIGEEFRERVGGLLNIDEKTKKEVPEGTAGSIKVVKNLEEFKVIATNLRVLARSSPQDKFILVTGLRQLDEVVAVTGDGANDAPALKKSNVGFAMHIAGTQLAQEAADIILLDDNFASIVVAVKWGRNIYDCISKFIQFQLTVNIVALVLSFIGACVIETAPLTAVQMLWVNLIMDTFAALALATEPPSDDLLNRPPVRSSDSLITVDMMKFIIGQSLYQCVWLLVILFLGDELFGVEPGWDQDDGPSEHFTLFFNTFVFMQVFNEINCRKLKSSELNVFKGFFNNWLFIAIIIGTIIVQVLIVTFGGAPLSVTALTLEQHGWCALIGVGGLVFGVFVRLMPSTPFRCCKFSESPLASQQADKTSLASIMRRRTSAAVRTSTRGFRN